MKVGTLAPGPWGIGGGLSPGDCARATPSPVSAQTTATAISQARLRIRGSLAPVGPAGAIGTAGWKNERSGSSHPETPGADPGPQSADEHLDARLPARPARR